MRTNPCIPSAAFFQAVRAGLSQRGDGQGKGRGEAARSGLALGSGSGSKWGNGSSPSTSPSPWDGLRGTGGGKGVQSGVPSGIQPLGWAQAIPAWGQG